MTAIPDPGEGDVTRRTAARSAARAVLSPGVHAAARPHLNGLIAAAPLPLYETLFAAVSATLTEFAASPRHLGGVSAFSKSQFQIDCWAATPLAAKTLGNAVQEALDAFHGSQSGIRIGEIALDDRRDNFQPPTDGSDLIVPGVSLDFTILHGE